MLTASLFCSRVRDGKPAAVALEIDYSDDGRALPVLTIRADWRKRLQCWGTQDVYRIEEIPSHGGRAWLLHRSEQAIAADEGDAYYGVEIESPESHRCECRGHAARGYCKHVSALMYLIGGGHLSHPMADAPADDPFRGVELV
jgi:hypothetical protein